MNEIVTKIKMTSELAEREVNDLITLKQQHWEYSVEEQKKWLANNIFPDDIHLLVYEGGVLLAYLNIVHVDIRINNLESVNLLGIGNVCVDKSNKRTGVGVVLMSIANTYIKRSKSCGLLLCRNKLKSFYEKTGWMVCKGVNVLLDDRQFDETTMIYDPFKILPDTINEMVISRNF